MANVKIQSFKEEEEIIKVEDIAVKNEEDVNDILDVKIDYFPPKEETPILGDMFTPGSPSIRPPSIPGKVEVDEPVKTEVLGGDIIVKSETTNSQPKLVRTTSQRVLKQSKVLFSDLPDKTAEAKKSFKVMKACSYDPKYLADSGQEEEIMSCDCRPAFVDGINQACDENSNCINRSTCMECMQNDASCGGACKNQRFQNREYADVSVFQTDKKGYGLRANVDLVPNTFIYEYVGEVIDDHQFRERKVKYGEEGIKHFYFMSIQKGQFIDATKKGCLARFCNHSCNPNCMVEKWVVGNKLRMGIFTNAYIQAGEELTFDYNVDRYGAEPQPCFCAEPNCIGFIGGKTQTESATKLPAIFAEALGISDADGWRTATAKKPKRRKDDDDEDYVAKFKVKAIERESVQKVMGSLMQTQEKWMVIRLLDRILLAEDLTVQAEVMRLHGYQIFNTNLQKWKDDDNIITTILEIMSRWPTLTKNKISSSKIESTIQEFTASENEKIRNLADGLAASWSKLEMGYRIPRKARGTHADSPRPERRERALEKSESKSKSPDPPKRPATPTGPKGNGQRPPFHDRHQRPHRPPPPRPPLGDHRSRQNSTALPSGWSSTIEPQSGKVYYFNIQDGRTQWDKPTQASLIKIPPPPPPGALPISTEKLALQKIIDAASAGASKKKEDEQASPANSGSQNSGNVKNHKKSKPFDEAKTRALLTKMFAKVVPNVVARYEKEIGGREEVKRQAKKITELLVTKELRRKEHVSLDMTDSRKHKIKEFVKTYMGKVVKHFKEEQARKGVSASISGNSAATAILKDTDIDMPDSPGDVNGEEEDDTSPASDSVVDARDTRETTTLSTPLEKLTPSDPISSPKRKRVEDDEMIPSSAVADATMITPSSLSEDFRPSKRPRSISQTPSRHNSPEPFITAAA